MKVRVGTCRIVSVVLGLGLSVGAGMTTGCVSRASTASAASATFPSSTGESRGTVRTEPLDAGRPPASGRPLAESLHTAPCASMTVVANLRNADRQMDADLNNDGKPEMVRAQSATCDERGNCHWTVAEEQPACTLIRGVLRGKAMELRTTSMASYLNVYFVLGGDRFLSTTYELRNGVYTAQHTDVCQRQTDVDVVCAPTP